MKTITRDNLWKSFDAREKITLVEALPQEDFDDGHIPGAFRLTPDEVESKAQSLLPDRNEVIVVYGTDINCTTSPKVAAKLNDLGYSKVYHYREGKADWIAAGFPVESTSSVGRM